MRLEHLLLQWNDRDTPYVSEHSGRQLTYAACCRKVVSSAEKLLAWGLSNTNVGIISAKGLEYIVAYWSALTAGATVVPLSHKAAATELCRDMTKCDCAWLICDSSCLGLAQIAAATAGAGVIVIDSQLGVWRMRSTASIRPRLNDANVALLIKTSGSTEGPSRYVALYHENLIANSRSHALSLELNGDDRVLIVLPLYYSFTNSAQLLCHTQLGGQLIHYDEKLFFPKSFCQCIERHGVTVTSVVPSLLHNLASYPYLTDHNLVTLRFLTFGGASSSAHVIRKLSEKITRTQLVHTYGLTEAAPRVTSMLGTDNPEDLGSIGKPIPGVSVKILNDDGNVVGSGEVGEMYVRGPNVMVGYYRAAQATSSVLKDGWLKTGDLGMRDSKGYLFFKGRLKNVIVCGGLNMCPEEIESVLINHPQVREVIVRGEPDEQLGEILVAHVALRGNSVVSLNDMHQFLRGRLAPTQWPRKVYVHRSLCKTDTGKPRRLVPIVGKLARS